MKKVKSKKNLKKFSLNDKKFINYIESTIKKTLAKYKLANKKEKLLIACSGGKDSMTVLYLMHKFGYNIEAFIIDLMIGSWSKTNLENSKKFCSEIGVKLHIISMRKKYGTSMCYIRQAVKKQNPKLSNCVICGVLKRWMLNKESRLLKASKIATGHNLSDEVSSFLMNLLKGNILLSLSQSPETGVIKDKKFIPRIKPLFFLTDEEIKKYALLMKFPVLYERCPCSVNAFRREITTIVSSIEKRKPEIRKNIINNFFKILPKLRRKYKTKDKLRYCIKCGEPSKSEICSACKLLNIKF